MKYIVVSCVEREIELEGIFKEFNEAYEKMKECFLYHHRNIGYTNEEIEKLKLEIESQPDIENSNYGFNSCGSNYAWSNEDDDYNFDIKIFEL